MEAPVAVTGAAGFVGSYLVRLLRAQDLPVRAVIRSTGDAAALRALGCEVAVGDVRDRASLLGAFTGCRAVVHLVAIIRERGGQTFDEVNRQGTANAVAVAREAGVPRVVHMSALGAAPDAPLYLRSKWDGEEEVRRSAVPFVIFRPSFLIGPGGGVAAQLADVVRFALWYPLVRLLGGRGLFAALARLTPVVPVLGSGQYRSMPVAIDDVLGAMGQALTRDDVLGHTYEIGGPEVLTYDALLDRVARTRGVRRWKVHLPMPVVRAAVAAFALMPDPLITKEEADALFTDNVCDNAPAVRTFGLQLRPVDQALGEALAGTGEKTMGRMP